MDFQEDGATHSQFQEKPKEYDRNSYQGKPNNYSGSNNSGGSSNYRNNGNWNNRDNSSSGGGFKKNFRKPEELKPEDVVLYKPYTVTANKEIPDNVLENIKKIIKELEIKGYILRTGGMDGPEDAFEKSTSKKEIYLPWRGFAEKESKFTYAHPAAKILAARYQSGFDGLKNFVQAFLIKNVRIVLGTETKSPSLFMIVWTEDGAESLSEKSVRTGNSGHAIAIASDLGIPIFNFGKPDAEQRLRKYLNLANG